MTDILDDAYESDLTDEEHKRLILMSEHAIAKYISATSPRGSLVHGVLAGKPWSAPVVEESND
jgi:hypothetical protein